MKGYKENNGMDTGNAGVQWGLEAVARAAAHWHTGPVLIYTGLQKTGCHSLSCSMVVYRVIPE